MASSVVLAFWTSTALRSFSITRSSSFVSITPTRNCSSTSHTFSFVSQKPRERVRERERERETDIETDRNGDRDGERQRHAKSQRDRAKGLCLVPFFYSHTETEQKEYLAEGLQAELIKFKDNAEILDLIENKPRGILSLLEEESAFPKATDKVREEKRRDEERRGEGERRECREAEKREVEGEKRRGEQEEKKKETR
jgi:hypothetical protein